MTNLLERNSSYINHIITCGKSDCNYYQRLLELFGNKRLSAEVGGPAVLAVTTGALCFATGGLAILVIGALSIGSLIGAGILTENNVKKNIKEIENELKEKNNAFQAGFEEGKKLRK